MGRTLSLVKFITGTRSQLDAENISDGNVYFLPDANDGLGDIAFDLDGQRSWVTSSKIMQVQDLDTSIPKLGELIVVTDGLRTIDTETGVTTVLPGLKIGDGITTLDGLPYLNEGYRVNADILTEQYEKIEAKLDNHIEDTSIHHTKNAQVVASGDQFVLQILNYD